MGLPAVVIPLNPHQMPASTVRLTKHDGTPTTPFYYLLHSLFQRGGGNTGVINTSGATLSAAGASQADAPELVNDFNEITDGTGGVRLKALQPGQQHRVFNGTAGNLNVYPATDGQINALGNNTPYVLPSGTTQIFWVPALMSNGGSQYRTITLG